MPQPNHKHALLRYPLAGFILVLAGCGAWSGHRSPNDAATRIQDIKRIAVLPVQARIYHYDIQGARRRSPELEASTAEAIENAASARIPSLERVGSEARGTRANIDGTPREEAVAHLAAVSTAIVEATYMEPPPLPDKLANFDYTVGSITAGELSDAAAEEADALFVLYVRDVAPTAGRTAASAASTLAKAALVVGAANAGIMVVPLAGKNRNISDPATVVYAALLDAATGDILWFNAAVSNDLDLSDEYYIEFLTGVALARLPSKVQ